MFSNNRKVQRARPLGGLEQAKAISLASYIGTAGLARPVEARHVGKLDRDLLAALDKLGFDITDGRIAKIRGDMTIRLLRPFDGLLKFVVELPDGKEMIFDLDEHTQVEIIEATKHWQ